MLFRGNEGYLLLKTILIDKYKVQYKMSNEGCNMKTLNEIYFGDYGF